MSTKVEFKFDSALPHQAKAIDSTVAIFDNIPKRHQGLYANSASYMLEPRNPQITLGTRLLENLQQLQLGNEIFVDETLHNGHFAIEMETGTGKTYVYLRSILSLYETYGFKKFMIVVPSVAIRKGVEKTLEQLQTHLKTLHNVDISKHSFVYDSGNLGRMKTFVETHDLDICVINAQAFASAKTLIQKEQEQGGDILWEQIKDIHPIVIIDEPQKVEGSKKKPSKSREQLSELSPLFELKYSATHRMEFPFNMLYSLDSFQAYEQQLVKRIRVKTVYGQIPKDQPYIRYVKFNRDLTATIELFTQEQGGRIKATKHRVENNADLHELSGNLPQYAGYRINAQPHKEKPLAINTGAVEIDLDEGSTNMEMAQNEAKRIQIRLAIESHFDKQWELLDAGHDIKILTLFFIDEVAKVRDDEQPDGRGEYLRIFDEEYEAYLNKAETQFKLNEYRYLFPKDVTTESVREGYFARDKKNAVAELKYNRAGTAVLTKSQEDIDRGIELILEKKDELITFKEPLAFIFSHSALREGWDNPNVFTLCTLRKSNSDIAKKQEIGRGLRLPVDINGNRITSEQHNVLTVIANDHYDHFADTLQKDFNEEMGFHRDEVTQTLLQNTLVAAGIPTEKITPDLVNALRTELTRKKIITDKNILTKDAAEKITEINFAHETLQEHAINIKKQFNQLMEKKGSRKVKIENGDVDPITNAECKYVQEGDFKSILDHLTTHLSKRTLYQFELDSDDFIGRCIRKSNEHFRGRKLIFTTKVETGDVGFDEAGKVITTQDNIVREEETEYTTTPTQFRKTDLQIVDHIMYHTMMPRMAILEIVKGFHNRELLNSQDILEEFTQLISKLLTAAKAKAVHAYEVVQGYELDRSQILEADVIDEELLAKQIKRVYRTKPASKRAVHEYYNMDSDGEFDFAEQLDADEKVILFTKLKKGGFVIDTPNGNYSPDWAIVYKTDDAHLKLYFIVETKADKEWEDLSDVEQSKIKCGGLHFKAVSDEIKFDWVNSYKDFQRKFAV
ncbi:MAG: DEAD/DEAH box helicase family protein [Verrucomicrobiales bacterium]|nr:DEAD/DEAH box helicase family protein [Verrucomicrobiales bacterium]